MDIKKASECMYVCSSACIKDNTIAKESLARYLLRRFLSFFAFIGVHYLLVYSTPALSLSKDETLKILHFSFFIANQLIGIFSILRIDFGLQRNSSIRFLKFPI